MQGGEGTINVLLLQGLLNIFERAKGKDHALPSTKTEGKNHHNHTSQCYCYEQPNLGEAFFIKTQSEFQSLTSDQMLLPKQRLNT